MVNFDVCKLHGVPYVERSLFSAKAGPRLYPKIRYTPVIVKPNGEMTLQHQLVQQYPGQVGVQQAGYPQVGRPGCCWVPPGGPPQEAAS